MRTAEVDGLISRSPCIGIELPAETSHEEMHFLSPEQVYVPSGTRSTTATGSRLYTAAYTVDCEAGRALGVQALAQLKLLRRRLEVVESLSEVRRARRAWVRPRDV